MLRITSGLLTLLLFLPASSSAAPGDLDPTFNGTGTVVTAIASGGARATSVVRQEDGKLVAAGFARVPVQGNPDNLDFALVRYDATGMPDSSFGGTGIVTTPIRDGDDTAEAVIQQADGKILAAGASWDGVGFNNTAITLARYLDDGSLDPMFGGGDGKVVLTPNIDLDFGMALIQQADGKIVVAGSSGEDILVVRLELDGTPDGTFNGTGIVTTTIADGAATALALLQQSDAKLVVAGFAGSNVAVVRYGTTGTPDAMFGGGDGIVTTPGTTGTAQARGIVQQADGKLVVAGYTDDPTQRKFALVRYDVDGDVDSAFGDTGLATAAFGSNDAEATALAQQGDGQLVAVGWASNGTSQDFALARFSAEGDPDQDFGLVTTPAGATSVDTGHGLLIQGNGGIVVAGWTRVSSSSRFMVARYLSLAGTTTSSTITTTTTSTVPTTSTVTTSTVVTTSIAATTSTVVTTTIGSTTTLGATTTIAGSTTTIAGSTTTSTTLAVVLVPGGQTAGDCYLELQVRDVTPAQVQNGQVVSCTDGDACDQGPCGDDRCDVQVAACASQDDPALPQCTPPATLDSVKLSGALAGSAGQLLAGPACGTPAQLQVPIKLTKRGTYQRGKSRVIVRGNAKAPKGVSPRKDKDKWTIQCLPRTGACPP